MNRLVGKKILLGVGGGIAIYKSASLVRRLRDEGAEVRVIMTEGATQLVAPLTFQALSGHPVHTRLFDANSEYAMNHIDLARWCDTLVIAPATANTVAALAHGLADSLLTTVCLASRAPLLVAPAMNQQMWSHPATQENVRTLIDRHVSVIGPASGDQACGETGPGRMVEPDEIVDGVVASFQSETLLGRHVIVTAGPTREVIDPVRFISNRSSGKMGFAVAAAAREAGADVTLVAGPVHLETPAGVTRIDVGSAEEMLGAVEAGIDQCDIFIATAAVADYRVQQVATDKIKKQQASLNLSLVRTPDILACVSSRPDPPFTVGFAAETSDLADHAQQKLRDKHLDMVAANLVGGDKGFDSDENELTLFWNGGQHPLSRKSKSKLARELIAVIGERYHANKDRAENT